MKSITSGLRMVGLLAGAAITFLAVGIPATAQTRSAPARNPFLAAESYAIAHFDPSQSDVMPFPAPRGVFHIDPQKTPRVWRGPINILTAASTSADHMWGFSSEGVTLIDVSAGGFRELARASAPSLKVISPESLRAGLGQSLRDIAQVEKTVFET